MWEALFEKDWRAARMDRIYPNKANKGKIKKIIIEGKYNYRDIYLYNMTSIKYKFIQWTNLE